MTNNLPNCAIQLLDEQLLGLMTPEEKQQTLELLQTREKTLACNKIQSFYPADGPLRRELYAKHLQYFAAGKDHRERAFIAANRIGKTEGVGAYELTLHLTGRYPDWWVGRRFDAPIASWAAGDSAKTCKDILQYKMLGRIGEFGTGMVPRDCLVRWTPKPGLPDAIESVFVKHASGGISELTFRSYEMGVEAFQGTERHVIWLDEEAPREVYVECLMRTMTVNGIVLLTFTPLFGMSDVVRDFLLEPQGRFAITATWDDCPHLSPEAKRELLNSIPPYQREARTKGVPQLGSGAIYQIPESDLVVDDFPIPDYYPRAYGMDVGWNRTAAVWGAKNQETGIVYLYSEYYQSQAEPSVHAHGILARGKWIPGVIDPAARGRSQKDGTQLIHEYQQLGLNILPAINAVESGIFATWELMTSGKLKVFRSLSNWLSEFRLYARDKDGKVTKARDHLMDCTRYLVMSGRDRMKANLPIKRKPVHVPTSPWA